MTLNTLKLHIEGKRTGPCEKVDSTAPTSASNYLLIYKDGGGAA